MYNGIGLPTPRGSGTNGFVQRNLAHVKKSRLSRPDFVSKSDGNIEKPPNFELITHEKKRQIEAKCLKLRLYLEQEGESESRIEREVDEYRRRKLKELSRMAEHSHNDDVKRSFGISRDYVDGSAVTQMKKNSDVKKESEVKLENKPKVELNEVKKEIKTEAEVKKEKESQSRREKERRRRRRRRSRSNSRSRSRSRSHTLAKVRLPACIILDIEGTTTSLRFIKDVLFPYIKRNLAKYLRERWQSEEMVATLARLLRQEERDTKEGLNPPRIWKLVETSDMNKVIESIVGNVIWQMDNKRHNTALKQLQILVWVYGYENNELRGHVYEDVGVAFRKWRSMGIRLFAYSTGMAVAQQLLFSNSTQGNLLNLIENYFDLLVGSKTQPASFRKIATFYMNVPTGQVLFITDSFEEARAAKEAGCQVVLVQRPDNRRITNSQQQEFSVVNSFNQIEFN